MSESIVFGELKHGGAPSRRRLLATLLLLLAPMASPDAGAQDRSGEEVVNAVCIKCHGPGTNGAPRIGDSKAWNERAKQGLTGLTQHALDGVRKMPAHGGNLALSDLEIGRAITYMVNRSGGQWVEPVAPQALTAERSGEQIVKARCANCHETGVGGAPKIGDRRAWIPRVKQGFDNVVRSAIRGHGGMPPRGGMADLTDTEIRAAVAYMFNQGGAPQTESLPGGAGKSGAMPAKAGPNHVSAGGMEIFLGVVPAEALRSYAKDSAEATMHGGVPGGRGRYHLNISLFDSASNAAIEHALVDAQVEQPGIATESKRLEPMVANNAP